MKITLLLAVIFCSAIVCNARSYFILDGYDGPVEVSIKSMDEIDSSVCFSDFLMEKVDRHIKNIKLNNLSRKI